MKIWREEKIEGKMENKNKINWRKKKHQMGKNDSFSMEGHPYEKLLEIIASVVLLHAGHAVNHL